MRKMQARRAVVDLLSISGRPIPTREIVQGVAGARPDINKPTAYRFIKSLLTLFSQEARAARREK